MTTTMSASERESFLADMHYGVLSVADTDGRGPLMMPIGYLYEPGGDIRVATGSNSRKMQLIREAGRVGFLVQTEELPVKYVSIEGPAVAEEPAVPEEHHAMSIRYLGPEQGERHFEATRAALPEMVTVRIRPERWRTYDSSRLTF